MHKKRLFTPGPTPIPESIQLRMAEPIIHHRHGEFKEIFKRVQSGLKYLFQSKEDVILLASSGTGSLEAMISNFTNKDEILVVNGGKFGKRWRILGERYGNIVHEIVLDYGKSVRTEAILQKLKSNRSISHLFLTHSETSVGASTNVKEIAKEVKAFNSGIFIAVDGITSIGCQEFRFDEWQIDVASTGSQKGLMLPPGLAFITASQFAWTKYKEPQSIYFDLKSAREQISKNGTSFTPSVSLILGLEKALEEIQNEGIEKLWERHQILADATRLAVRELGLELFAENPSNALTAIKVPQGIDGNEFVARFKELCGMTIANGQDDLKGKIFRLSHLGYYDEFDIISMLAALEKVLLSYSYNFELGSAVKRAMEELFQK